MQLTTVDMIIVLAGASVPFIVCGGLVISCVLDYMKGRRGL